MATSQMREFIQHLRRAVLLREGSGLTDGQLLKDYLNRREEAALAALVRRHGPMVWGVCRRVLRNDHDAEDAFQATFLVLVRKAASIVSPELLANWLYGVAHQTALKARATTAKRKVRERPVTEMPEPAVTERDLWNDLLPLLDQELSRLPDKYRVAVVLCELEGKTRKEAARQLGVPEGTLAARVARGRVMLAKRLARHGPAVSGGALAVVLSQNVASASAPTSVVSSTIKAATSVAAGQAVTTAVVSSKVAALTEGVVKAMLLTRLKTGAVALLVTAVISVGTAALTWQPSVAAQPQAQDEGAPPDKANDQESVRKVLATGVDALNKHDAKAFGAVFHADAEFSQVAGAGARGREGIVLVHQPFIEKFKKAVVTPGEPRIRFLRPDVATVDIRWSVAGMIGPDGKDRGAQNGLAMVVLTKEKGIWGVAAYHLAELPAPPSKKP
jgi:uncharacterized protein (TIGR02246 family)